MSSGQSVTNVSIIIKAMEKENQSKSATTQSQQEEKTQILTDKELEELKRISEAKSAMLFY